jgi:hypothetical protein
MRRDQWEEMNEKRRMRRGRIRIQEEMNKKRKIRRGEKVKRFLDKPLEIADYVFCPHKK